MTRLRAALCAVALPIVVWSFAGAAAAAEPEPEAPKAGQLPNLGGFENSIPLAIGGGITVGVLLVGFLVLNAKKPQPPPSLDQPIDPDHLPGDVVGGPSPLRYFVMPVVLVALLAVGIPLGYSVWKSFPDTESLFTHTKEALQQMHGAPPPPVDSNRFRFAPIPAPPAIGHPPAPVRDPAVPSSRIGR
jgi:hypothetical protein